MRLPKLQSQNTAQMRTQQAAPSSTPMVNAGHDAMMTGSPMPAGHMPPPTTSAQTGHGVAGAMAKANELKGLPVAKPMPIIELNDGDRLPMAMKFVRKTINGVTIRGYSYNGSIPGPIVKVPQGATIKIPFVNKTDYPTTLHSHGIHGDFRMDGVPDRPYPAIKPNESFEYAIKFPDAGVFWYHPHVNDWHARELGAAGVYVVEPSDPTYYSKVNREEVLVLDDIDIKDGAVGVSDPDSPSHVLMGRFGNTMLTNGETDYSLDVKRGDVVRFHILNASDVRPYNFSIPGAKMKLVGSDVGKNEREEWAESVLITPSERYTVEVMFEAPGAHAIVNAKPDGTKTTLGTVVVSETETDTRYDKEFFTLRDNRDVQASIDPFRALLDKPADKQLTLTVDMSMDGGGGMDHGAMGDGGGMDHGAMGATTPAPATGGGMDHGAMGATTPAPATGGGMDHGAMGATTPAPATGGGMDHGAMGSPMPGMSTGVAAGTTPLMNHGAGGMVPQANLPLHSRTNGIEWEDGMPQMNETSTLANTKWKLVDPQTGAVNMDIDWKLKKDEPVMIELFNDPNSAHPMQHPIHFHGMPFLVASINGETNPNLAWKDSVVVRPGERVKVLLDTFNAGDWMFHCHISRHSAGHNMMGKFSVTD